MSDRRKGPRSIEQRVWKWAHGRGEFATKEVAEKLRITHWSAIQAVMRLRRKGCVEKCRGQGPKTRRYRAIGDYPEDWRGLTPGSIAVLRKGFQKPKAPTAIPKPATALEAAWGFLPVSKVAPTDESCEDASSTRPARVSLFIEGYET